MKDRKDLKLLLVGDANWDYYLDDEFYNTVFYIAKPGSGCASGVFGSLDYFKNWVIKKHKQNDKIETRLTALGFKVTGIEVKL